MTIRNRIILGVRTASQVAVAAGIAWLASRGIEVPEVPAREVFGAVAVGAVAIVLDFAQAQWPIIGRILSWGLTTSSPSYEG